MNMPNVTENNVPTQPQYSIQDKVAADKFRSTDSKGNSIHFIFASVRFLREDHSTTPKFDLRTRSMLVVPRPNRTYKPVWEGFISSQVDNTPSLDPIPVSRDQQADYAVSTRSYHPMRGEFAEQMKPLLH